MARRTRKRGQSIAAAAAATTSGVDELLLAALAQGGERLETGRFLVTFKEGAVDRRRTRP